MIEFENILKTLNDKQKNAVMHVNGPLFVAAGAGTGKTRTLTSRLAYLIINNHAEPENLLAVTFTNKAAKEMKERVAKLVGDEAYRMWVLTFHAFGLRILRRHINVLEIKGLNQNFNVCDDDDSVLIVKNIIKDLNIDLKSFQPKRVRTLLSKFQNNEIDIFSKSQNDNLLYEKILTMYQERLINDNLIDFDGLLLYTLRIFQQYREIRERYQELFKYILVDEFQDTNIVQYNIIKLLGINHSNVFVVGDPDQSIYSFRGANYANNQLFLKEFQAQTIVLDKNYRSFTSILKKANSLISFNKSRVTKKELESDLGSGNLVEISRFNNDLEETYFVAREIRVLLNSGYKCEDIAILYRNNNLSRIIEETLARSQIPYVIYGGISFFERREIKDVLAYIRVALDLDQNFYLKRIINVPKRRLGDSVIEKLEDKAFDNGVSLYDAIDDINVVASSKEGLKEFKNIMNILIDKLDSDEPLETLIDNVLDVAKYLDYLKEEGEEGLDRIDNVRELKNIFARGAYYYEGPKREKLQSILDEISLITDLDQTQADEDRVILSTYHQVKGLEFKVVFLIALEDGIFPNSMRFESEAELEEERRVCYVGITRAQERLYISSAKQRFRFGHVEYMQDSRFIKEMNKSSEKIVSSTTIKENVGLLKSGDRVTHMMFGDGVVVQVKDKVATIAFKMPHGIKHVMEDHPSLRKI